MTYFLDFDRTLFDTERALPYIFGKPACANISGTAPYKELVSELKILVEQGALFFAEGELSQFLFSDTVEFLGTHESVIVTAGSEVWQRMKVESALFGIQTPVIYTGDVPKGLILKDALANANSPFYFTDDSQTQLESVTAECPAVEVFEMRRDGEAGSGKYSVVRSLAELPQ